jgi:Fe-S-cluster containining protein
MIENLKQKAQEKKAENEKFFKKLKQRPPKNLDITVQAIHEEVFAQTDCLSCANCCKTTSPIVTEKDIVRIAKHLRIKESDFIAQYLFRDTDGEWAMQQTPCLFLDAENYCLIYDVRPKACAEYPHTNRRKFIQIAQLTIKNTEICPAVYDIVESLKTVDFTKK